MKVGDFLPVEVAGIRVTEAKIIAMDAETVTFVVPGTEVTAGLSHGITDLPEREVEVDRVLLDTVERDEPDTEGEEQFTNATVQGEISLKDMKLDDDID